MATQPSEITNAVKPNGQDVSPKPEAKSAVNTQFVFMGVDATRVAEDIAKMWHRLETDLQHESYARKFRRVQDFVKDVLETGVIAKQRYIDGLGDRNDGKTLAAIASIAFPDLPVETQAKAALAYLKQVAEGKPSEDAIKAVRLSYHKGR